MLLKPARACSGCCFEGCPTRRSIFPAVCRRAPRRDFRPAQRPIRIGFVENEFDGPLNDRTNPENVPPTAEDRRASTRKRTLFGGIVSNRAGTLTWNCTIRNISETGAQIRLASDQGKTFDQTVPTECILIDLANAMAHTATVEWRSHPSFGVRFVKSYALEGQTDPVMQFAKALWQERRKR